MRVSLISIMRRLLAIMLQMIMDSNSNTQFIAIWLHNAVFLYVVCFTYMWHDQIDAEKQIFRMMAGTCAELSSWPDWWPKRCPIITCLLGTRYLLYILCILCTLYILCTVPSVDTAHIVQYIGTYCTVRYKHIPKQFGLYHWLCIWHVFPPSNY